MRGAVLRQPFEVETRKADTLVAPLIAALVNHAGRPVLQRDEAAVGARSWTGSPIEKITSRFGFVTPPLSPSRPTRVGCSIQAPHVPRTPRTLNAVSEVVLAQLYLLRRDGYRVSRR